MITSHTTLCSRRVLQRAKLACRCSVKAARALRGQLACIREPENDDWCNGNSIQSAYFRYDSDISKCKQSLFARYRAPLTSNSLERDVDANTVSDVAVPSQLSTLKLIICRTKIILATGKLTN